MTSIIKLDKYTIRRITSGQVITDLGSVLKELVENSLDAQSTVITVRLLNFGLEQISVDDNGTGIALDDTFEVLESEFKSRKYNDRSNEERQLDFSSRATTKLSYCVEYENEKEKSKILSFDANENNMSSNNITITTTTTTTTTTTDSSSYNESLCNKCELKSNLHIDTLGFRGLPFTVEILKEDMQGTLSARITTSRQCQGTTVIITKLFRRFPVRQLNLEKNCRKQLSKAIQLLRQYAVSNPTVKLNVLHQENEGADLQTLISTSGSGDLLRSVTEMYGGVKIAQMHFVQWTLSCGEINGLVSNICNTERIVSNYQVLVLNGRLVDLPSVSKAINDAYLACGSVSCKRSSVSFFIRLNFNDNIEIDINLSPNKRKIAVVNEESIAHEVYNAALQEFQQSLEKSNMEYNTSISRERQNLGNAVPLIANYANNNINNNEIIIRDNHNINNNNILPSRYLLSRYTFRIDNKESEKKVSEQNKDEERIIHLSLLAPYLYAQENNKCNMVINNYNFEEKTSNNNIPTVINDYNGDYNIIEDKNIKHKHCAEGELLASREEEDISSEIEIQRSNMEFDNVTCTENEERSNCRQDELPHKQRRTEKSQSEFNIITANHETLHHIEENCLLENCLLLQEQLFSKQNIAEEIYGINNNEMSDRQKKIVTIEHAQESNELLPSSSTTHISASLTSVCDKDFAYVTDKAKNRRLTGEAITLQVSEEYSNKVSAFQINEREPWLTSSNEIDTMRRSEGEWRGKETNLMEKEASAHSHMENTFSSLTKQSEEELTSYFHKRSFEDMQVVGQFNQGFIITFLKNDLFVIDQHASDEKYNYEHLLRSYKAKPQRLVQPILLKMDLFDTELACIHKMELLKHGFEIEKHNACETEIIIKSIPVLPYDIVKADDIMELIEQLSVYGSIVNPLRAVLHSMATKACRSSIMIGTVLTSQVMQNIVSHLATLVEP